MQKNQVFYRLDFLLQYFYLLIDILIYINYFETCTGTSKREVSLFELSNILLNCK